MENVATLRAFASNSNLRMGSRVFSGAEDVAWEACSVISWVHRRIELQRIQQRTRLATQLHLNKRDEKGTMTSDVGLVDVLCGAQG